MPSSSTPPECEVDGSQQDPQSFYYPGVPWIHPGGVAASSSTTDVLGSGHGGPGFVLLCHNRCPNFFLNRSGSTASSLFSLARATRRPADLWRRSARSRVVGSVPRSCRITATRMTLRSSIATWMTLRSPLQHGRRCGGHCSSDQCGETSELQPPASSPLQHRRPCSKRDVANRRYAAPAPPPIAPLMALQHVASRRSTLASLAQGGDGWSCNTTLVCSTGGARRPAMQHHTHLQHRQMTLQRGSPAATRGPLHTAHARRHLPCHRTVLLQCPGITLSCFAATPAVAPGRCCKYRGTRGVPVCDSG